MFKGNIVLQLNHLLMGGIKVRVRFRRDVENFNWCGGVGEGEVVTPLAVAVWSGSRWRVRVM